MYVTFRRVVLQPYTRVGYSPFYYVLLLLPIGHIARYRRLEIERNEAQRLSLPDVQPTTQQLVTIIFFCQWKDWAVQYHTSIIPTSRRVSRHYASLPPQTYQYSVLTFLHTSAWNPPIRNAPAVICIYEIGPELISTVFPMTWTMQWRGPEVYSWFIMRDLMISYIKMRASEKCE